MPESASPACRRRHIVSASPATARSAMLPPMDNRSINDVGGTSGGLGMFLLGFAMACIGGFLITHQVSVVGSYWSFWGGSSFGITLLPMLFGVGILFWNGKSVIGWLLTVAGALVHLRRHHRQPAHLFSAHQPLQHHGDADPVGGRIGLDRALAPAAQLKAKPVRLSIRRDQECAES